MALLVFSQAEAGTIDLNRLVQHGARFFHANVDVQCEDPLELLVSSARFNLSERFTVTSRKTEPADLEAARTAEAQGQAAGMASLAARCPYIWSIQAVPTRPTAKASPAEVCLAGILASVGLGPVLPPDHETLYGVRGAIARVETQAMEKT